ncbi:MAG: segregation and condensation protein A [Christensenellales bacterium]|jgi:segregation and condensation protein A
MYIVQLDQFEGPLDLLLHLIRRAQIDIADIFVSQITQQYLDIMQAAESIDMEVSSEFIAMAATLVEIKSRSLLPRPPKETEEAQEDPEALLIRQLEEYNRFKQASEALRNLEALGKQSFYKLPEELLPPEPELDLEGVGVDALYEALKSVILRSRERTMREQIPRQRDIMRDAFTVGERIGYIRNTLKARRTMRFDELFEEAVTRPEIVTTFIAMLELMRMRRIKISQSRVYDPIVLSWRDRKINKLGDSIGKRRGAKPANE